MKSMQMARVFALGVMLIACEQTRRTGATGGSSGGADAAADAGTTDPTDAGSGGGDAGFVPDAAPPTTDSGVGRPDSGQTSPADTGPSDSGQSLVQVPGTSDGECPSLGASGIFRFSSGGLQRKTAVLVPSTAGQDRPMIFVFHGLTTLDQNPVENMVAGFQLQQLADLHGIVFIVPEARAQTLPGVGTLGIWGIMNDEAQDLTLFDDLLLCADTLLDIDLDRVSSTGHSGGALWTTALLYHRAAALASAAEFSGGAEFSLPFLGTFLVYQTPGAQVPTLLVSGGATDTWPQGQPLIQFEQTTDALQTGLVRDSHVVVRCRHELGHFQIPPRGWTLGIEWMLAHERGVASTFLPAGLTMHADWCQDVTN